MSNAAFIFWLKELCQQTVQALASISVSGPGWRGDGDASKTATNSVWKWRLNLTTLAGWLDRNPLQLPEASSGFILVPSTLNGTFIFTFTPWSVLLNTRVLLFWKYLRGVFIQSCFCYSATFIQNDSVFPPKWTISLFWSFHVAPLAHKTAHKELTAGEQLVLPVTIHEDGPPAQCFAVFAVAGSVRVRDDYCSREPEGAAERDCQHIKTIRQTFSERRRANNSCQKSFPGGSETGRKTREIIKWKSSPSVFFS